MRRWIERTVHSTVTEELDRHATEMAGVVDGARHDLEVRVQAVSERVEAAVGSDSDLAQALGSLVGALEGMVSEFEAQRRELARYVAGTEMLMRELVIANVQPVVGAQPARIIGGSLGDPAAIDATGTTGAEIDLREGVVVGAEVELRSHFRGGWVAGFRIVERVVEAETTLVRVERISDASVLPVLFALHEVRPADTVADPVSDPV